MQCKPLTLTDLSPLIRFHALPDEKSHRELLALLDPHLLDRRLLLLALGQPPLPWRAHQPGRLALLRDLVPFRIIVRQQPARVPKSSLDHVLRKLLVFHLAVRPAVVVVLDCPPFTLPSPDVFLGDVLVDEPALEARVGLDGAASVGASNDVELLPPSDDGVLLIAPTHGGLVQSSLALVRVDLDRLAVPEHALRHEGALCSIVHGELLFCSRVVR